MTELSPNKYNTDAIRMSPNTPDTNVKNDVIPIESVINIPNVSSSEEANKFYNEEDFELLNIKQLSFSLVVTKFRNIIYNKVSENAGIIKWITCLTFFGLYLGFFIWFIICKSRKETLLTKEDNIRMIWMTGLLILCFIYILCKAYIRWMKIELNNPLNEILWMNRTLTICWYIFICVITLALLYFIIFVLAYNVPYNLVSASGIVSLIMFSYLISNAPHMINWQTIMMGIFLQFILAFFILSTKPGYMVFKFLGDRVSDLLSFTDAGAFMLFGNTFPSGNFAFRILPIIAFLSSLISLLYHLGVIQVIIIVISTVMEKFMGTTSAESINAATNIFLGMTEAPLLIKPYLRLLTNSELAAIMTGGFATIAGSVFGAYVIFGAPANHLLSASVISAPAALAVSKIIYPETKVSKNKYMKVKKLIPSPHNNIVEAITVGASDSIPLIANIGVNLIAFVSLLSLFNAILAWMGERACMERKLTFELICSYLFWPLSFVMGVHFKDCRKVAELIGIKIFLNEFIAFQKLGIFIENERIYSNLNFSDVTYELISEDIVIFYSNGTQLLLQGGILEANRSIIIATYALCGFANMASMGIFLSSLVVLLPNRRADLSKIVIRSMIAGNIACFLTACIAGLFYNE